MCKVQFSKFVKQCDKLKPCACDLSRRLYFARPDINQFNELLFSMIESHMRNARQSQVIFKSLPEKMVLSENGHLRLVTEINESFLGEINGIFPKVHFNNFLKKKYLYPAVLLRS